jgi:hypothetical protein
MLKNPHPVCQYQKAAQAAFLLDAHENFRLRHEDAAR